MQKGIFFFLILSLCIGFFHHGFAYRAHFEDFVARVEFIREKLPMLDVEDLSWLGAQISWDSWFFEPYEQSLQGAEYRYRVRVRIYEVEPTNGTVTFAGEAVDLDLDKAHARTYYPDDFYSYQDLKGKFDQTHARLSFSNGTQSFEEEIFINFQGLEESELFPGPTTSQVETANCSLDVSNLDLVRTDWLWVETWTPVNNQWRTIEYNDTHGSSTASLEPTIDDPAGRSTTISFTESEYTDPLRYMYLVIAGNEGCEPPGWTCMNGNYEGLSFRTYEYGLFKDNTAETPDNAKLQGTFRSQLFGNLYPTQEVTCGYGDQHYFGNGVHEWTWSEVIPDFPTTANATFAAFYYATDDGGIDYNAGVAQGAIAHHGRYGGLVSIYPGDEHLTFLLTTSTGMDVSDLQGDYDLHLIGEDDLDLIWCARQTLSFDGSGSFNATVVSENTDSSSSSGHSFNGTYSVTANGTLQLSSNAFDAFGQVSADGEVLSLSRCEDQDRAIGVGVKKAEPVADSPELQGTYHVLGLGNDGSEFYSYLFNATVDTTAMAINLHSILYTDAETIGKTYQEAYSYSEGSLIIDSSDANASDLVGTVGDEGDIFIATTTSGQKELLFALRTEAPPQQFSAQLYLTLNPDVQTNWVDAGLGSAWEHYDQWGRAEGRPTFFDSEDYLEMNPDVANAIASGYFSGTAIDHYVNWGKREGRTTSFDAQDYLDMNPDVAAAGYTEDTAINHFLMWGWKEGRPTEFAAEAYLEAYPDVKAAVDRGVLQSALKHFIKWGKAEGRNPNPASKADEI